MADTPLPSITTRAAEFDYSGRRLGDYQILRRLGRGAMADVYLAEQTSLGRQVALKILKRELAADETYVKRFQNEARAAASLVHANIVQIFEVGSQDGAYYIAQEYVSGMNLGDLLSRRGSIDLPAALSIMRQTAAALGKAAERGIVHRDIKPENILMTRDGEAKIADFGLARISAADQSQALALTQVGITMGTPLYMSPEQVEGKKLDVRSDLYSLGITLYHLLSGRPPFRGDNALSVAVQHLKTEPERLEHVRPDLPAGLCRIIHRLLAKDPAERIQSPRALLVEVRALYRELGDDAWSEEWNDWDNTDLTALSDARLEATAQLGEAMKTQALIYSARGHRSWFIVLLLAAFVCGGAYAWWRRPESLLAASGTGIGIDRMKTAAQQYDHAMFYAQGKSPEAWNAVLRYFESDEKYVDLARSQLAWLYLDQKRYAEALEQYRLLSGKSEDFYHLRGLAGEAVIYFTEGKTADFERVWSQFEQRRRELENQQKSMNQYVNPELLRMVDDLRESR